jgi:hypothetical protein
MPLLTLNQVPALPRTNPHVILYWKQRASSLKDSDARSVIHENGNWKAK